MVALNPVYISPETLKSLSKVKPGTIIRQHEVLRNERFKEGNDGIPKLPEENTYYRVLDKAETKYCKKQGLDGTIPVEKIEHIDLALKIPSEGGKFDRLTYLTFGPRIDIMG